MRSHYKNVSCHVLVKSIVTRSIRQRHLLKSASEIVKMNPKNLKRYYNKRYNLTQSKKKINYGY